MTSKITFFPLGNADTTLFHLQAKNRFILWDYANKKGSDPDEKRCDLPSELNRRVPGDFDVVCFTHADEDHIKGMSEYFFLRHAAKYQTGNRKKIKELWVPASVLIDTETKNDDDYALRAEARYRLRQKEGILVFSKPDKMKDWLSKEGIRFEEVQHLFIDAGKFVPGWQAAADEVEFYVHAPFVGHVNENETIDRNGSGIIVQATFGNQSATKMLLGADGKASVWSDVVGVTRYHKHDETLQWDIFHISHHCSYTALNEDEKGVKKTTPIPKVKWLFENQGNEKCLLVSPSKPIEHTETTQPPHFQAYNYYKEDVAAQKGGQVIVTMEHPKVNGPEPLDVIVTETGYEIETSERRAAKMLIAQRIAGTSAVSGNHCNE